jgi:hypothetical protein
MRVVIADDEMIVREGLARLLAEAGFDVVGKATDGRELLRAIRLTGPDVAIVDIKMPPTHTDEGILAAHEIRAGRGGRSGPGDRCHPRRRQRGSVRGPFWLQRPGERASRRSISPNRVEGWQIAAFRLPARVDLASETEGFDASVQGVPHNGCETVGFGPSPALCHSRLRARAPP